MCCGCDRCCDCGYSRHSNFDNYSGEGDFILHKTNIPGEYIRYGYSSNQIFPRSFGLGPTIGRKSKYTSLCDYPRGLPSHDRYTVKGPFPIPCLGTGLARRWYLT